MPGPLLPSAAGAPAGVSAWTEGHLYQNKKGKRQVKKQARKQEPTSNSSGMRLAKRWMLRPGLMPRPPTDTAASTTKAWPSCTPTAPACVATISGRSSFMMPSRRLYSPAQGAQRGAHAGASRAASARVRGCVHLGCVHLDGCEHRAMLQVPFSSKESFCWNGGAAKQPQQAPQRAFVRLAGPIAIRLPSHPPTGLRCAPSGLANRSWCSRSCMATTCLVVSSEGGVAGSQRISSEIFSALGPGRALRRDRACSRGKHQGGWLGPRLSAQRQAMLACRAFLTKHANYRHKHPADVCWRHLRPPKLPAAPRCLPLASAHPPGHG
jgi:hypothetical protein